MKLPDDKKLETSDLALATSLVIFGFGVQSIERVNERKSIFIFAHKPGIEKTVQDFWNGNLNVEPRQFMSELKSLKSRIYSGM